MGVLQRLLIKRMIQEAEKLGVGDDTDLEWWCWPQWPAELR